MCKHLEALIDPAPIEPSFEGTHRRVYSNVDRISQECVPQPPKDSVRELRFRKTLKPYHLHAIQEDILTLRFVYEQSIRKISDSLKIVSSTMTFNLLNSALQAIKKGTKHGKLK